MTDRSTGDHGKHAGRLDETELDRLIADDDIDTVLVVFPDLQGRLIGKRVTGHFFQDHVLDDGIEACNYLLAVDVDMTPRARLRVRELGQGLRRLRLPPRPVDAALRPVAREDRARALRPLRRARRRAGRGVTPAHPAAPARARRRGRLPGDVRLGARVLPVPRLVRGGTGEGLRGRSTTTPPSSRTTTSSRRPATST